MVNDDSLLLQLPDINKISNITNNQQKVIRSQYIFLGEAYKLALQNMNTRWVRDIQPYIDELEDYGIVDTKKDKTIRKLNQQFRVSKQMNVP